MADGGHLVPPSQDPSKAQIWVETKKRLERFLPALFVEIFPDAARQETSAPVSGVSSPVIPSGEKDQDNKPSENVPEGEGDDGGKGDS